MIFEDPKPNCPHGFPPSVRCVMCEPLGTFPETFYEALRGYSGGDPRTVTKFRTGDVFEIPAPELPVPWSIDPEGTRAARTVTNGTYRYTFFGDDAPANAEAVRDALNAVAQRKKP